MRRRRARRRVQPASTGAHDAELLDRRRLAEPDVRRPPTGRSRTRWRHRLGMLPAEPAARRRRAAPRADRRGRRRGAAVRGGRPRSAAGTFIVVAGQRPRARAPAPSARCGSRSRTGLAVDGAAVRRDRHGDAQRPARLGRRRVAVVRADRRRRRAARAARLADDRRRAVRAAADRAARCPAARAGHAALNLRRWVRGDARVRGGQDAVPAVPGQPRGRAPARSPAREVPGGAGQLAPVMQQQSLPGGARACRTPGRSPCHATPDPRPACPGGSCAARVGGS